MRNEPTLLALCDALTANCGDMLRASKQAGVSLLFVQQWRKDDKLVDERLTEAAELGTQTLVSAAITRGVYGVDRDVYYKGDVVGQQKEYSDTLLQTLLKAKVKEFSRDSEYGGTPQVTVNIANLMPRATTYEEWLQMKLDTVAQMDAAKALPAPSAEVIEGELVPARADMETIRERVREITTPSAFKGIDL